MDAIQLICALDKEPVYGGMSSSQSKSGACEVSTGTRLDLHPLSRSNCGGNWCSRRCYERLWWQCMARQVLRLHRHCQGNRQGRPAKPSMESRGTTLKQEKRLETSHVHPHLPRLVASRPSHRPWSRSGALPDSYSSRISASHPRPSPSL